MQSAWEADKLAALSPRAAAAAAAAGPHTGEDGGGGSDSGPGGPGPGAGGVPAEASLLKYTILVTPPTTPAYLSESVVAPPARSLS
jgi:hypothetical protein